MEQKSVTVYIILFSLMAVVLFVLFYFDRDSAAPFQPETDPVGLRNPSLGDGNMVVYINWDGFAWYYYQLANSAETCGAPVLKELAAQGVLFTDARTGVPSITNPMQTSLLTGAWPVVTGNCYQYFDRDGRKLVRTGRTNHAETLAEAVTRQGRRAVSIHQFMLENRGTAAGDMQNPYIQLGDHADYAKRFDEASRYVKSLKNDELPAFLAIYMDDLDGIGHNNWFTYGVPPAGTEEKRLERIQKRLSQMDAKLGEFIGACKAAGIYEKVTFLLATDHGMTPYGVPDGKKNEHGYSKLPELAKVLQKLGFKTEILAEGKSPGKDTDIALATTGLQVQLFFTGTYEEAAVKKITTALSGQKYVGTILNKEELKARGTNEEFADLLVSARPPYCLHNDEKLHRAGGQHDSLDESSQHVFALMWGNGVKQGYSYSERVCIIDFAKTLSALMGVESPKNATGRLLDKALE